MMTGRRTIISAFGVVAALVVTMFIVQSCGIYSFTGTSIQPEVKTVTINYFEYKALKVNPSLSNDITTALQDKFLKLTKLEQVDMDGDLEIIGEISGYDVKATAITANEQAAQNRLTVSVRINFVNRKFPEDDFENKAFSAYADFDANESLDAVEASLCEEIIEQLCEDIFNATVANW
ncbi:MAG: LptE family protein [Bacteroidales bacterium]|nr:LptE family protein [Bacteroidales bacterium]